MDETPKRGDAFHWIHPFIATASGRGIGFCRYYPYEKRNESWHGTIDPKGAYSTGDLIREETPLGKGIGRERILALVLAVRSHPDAKRILFQPGPNNHAFCRTHLSAGFLSDEENRLYRLSSRTLLPKGRMDLPLPDNCVKPSSLSANFKKAFPIHKRKSGTLLS